MDALTALIIRAHELGVISALSGCSPLQHLSIYADNVVLFVRLSAMDMLFVRESLRIIDIAMGLQVNFAKSSTIMIRKEEGVRSLWRRPFHGEWKASLRHAGT